MAVMMDAVMRHIHNFFESERKDGVFTVRNGVITGASFITPGAYIAMECGCSDDGVWHIDEAGIAVNGVNDTMMNAGTYKGRVYCLHPPLSFVQLVQEISDYDTKNASAQPVSETFGNYSVTRASGSSGIVSWQDAYSSRLNPYRKMFTEVSV